MQQWEYMTWRVNNGSFLLTLVIGDPANQELYANLLFPDAIVLVGERGWELVTAMQAANTYTLIFKRPKLDERWGTERCPSQVAVPPGHESLHPNALTSACREFRNWLNGMRSTLSGRCTPALAKGAPA